MTIRDDAAKAVMEATERFQTVLTRASARAAEDDGRLEIESKDVEVAQAIMMKMGWKLRDSSEVKGPKE